MFLKIDGIDGGSTAKGHEGYINVMSFSWGAERPDGMDFSNFNFTQDVDKATPKLWAAMIEDKAFAWVAFIVRKEEKGQNFYYVKMTDVLVSSIHDGGHVQGGVPNANISLNFSELQDMWFKTPSGQKISVFGQ
jgi:type VI secretion system secreted protein Hcp